MFNYLVLKNIALELLVIGNIDPNWRSQPLYFARLISSNQVQEWQAWIMILGDKMDGLSFLMTRHGESCSRPFLTQKILHIFPMSEKNIKT